MGKFLIALFLSAVSAVLAAYMLMFGWNNFLLPHVVALLPLTPLPAYALALTCDGIGLSWKVSILTKLDKCGGTIDAIELSITTLLTRLCLFGLMYLVYLFL